MAHDPLTLALAQADMAMDPLAAALARATEPPKAMEPVAETPPEEVEAEAPSAGQIGKARLRGENQALRIQLERQTRFVRGLGAVAGLSLVAAVGMFFWARAQSPRMLEKAFRIIHYREIRAEEANAIVLDDYSTRMGGIITAVNGLGTISDSERALRVKSLSAAKSQADLLRDGFLRQAQESEKDNGAGGSFSYIDPFLKRPVDFDDDMGGQVDLDKLRGEITKASNMDQAMEEMRKVMTNPVPLSDQMAAEAKDQHAPTVGPEGVIPPSQMTAPGAGLQLPSVPLPQAPAAPGVDAFK